MTDTRERWALILGASRGMGEATAIALAQAGDRMCGIHLDCRAALRHVEEVKAMIAEAGSEALYINVNAADDEKRATALTPMSGSLPATAWSGPRGPRSSRASASWRWSLPGRAAASPPTRSAQVSP